MNDIERVQEILNRGLYDRLGPDKKGRVDEAIKRGLVTMPDAALQQEGFSAGVQIPQDQLTPVLSRDQTLKQQQEQEGRVGYGGDFSDVDPKVLRGGAEIAGAGLGTVLAGGNPMGGAAGYALVDQLFNKYQRGEEITPGGAAKSLGKGAMYEVLPNAAIKGAGKMVPEDFAKNLMQRAIKPPAGQADDYSAKMSQYMLDTDRGISRKTLEGAGENVRVANKEADRLIEGRIAAGERVSPLDVASDFRKGAKGKYEGIELVDDTLEGIDNTVDAWLSKQKDKYGSKLGTGYPESMPLQDAYSQRKALDKFAGGEFVKQQTKRNYQPTVSQRKMDDMVSLANAIRKQLNKDPATAAMMKTQKGELDLIRLVSEKLRKQGNKSLIPSEVMLPLIFETGIKGSPGLATAMGVGRAAGSNPRFLSEAALKANRLKTGKYQVPAAEKTLFAENLFNAYNNKDQN